MEKVKRLRHGGIMANYRCTATCRHCLYACSPARTDGYMDKETAQEVSILLKEGGCRSVHIGGGEPFLNFIDLLTLVETFIQSGIAVEYIETNAFWANNPHITMERLRLLSRAGADSVCISFDPFHAEYIPVKKPLFLAEICKQVDMGYFLWQDRYAQMLSRVDSDVTHDRETLEREVSPDYVWETAKSLHMGGRAVNIEAEFIEGKLLAEVVNENPCRGLLSGGHFHVDRLGRFIPPGCTGIAIPLHEAVRGVPKGKYPAFDALISQGVGGLLSYARKRGYMIGEDSEFPSPCALCFHIRHWLSGQSGCPELDKEHYDEALRYYN